MTVATAADCLIVATTGCSGGFAAAAEVCSSSPDPAEEHVYRVDACCVQCLAQAEQLLNAVLCEKTASKGVLRTISRSGSARMKTITKAPTS